ncbi:hypothetical protein DA075_21620 [Methylobacterium currus]|uniref:Inositolphosphotransferase Aur1/Ipt1 domain-containing protein n=1 Tax=Methylobacterium currus TaxID=2051553 RepID=A0A2R4WNR1_9HYPH|nr:phosphatase PAP2 family protein [Methylobacterium currus]AWB23182.1 hypothetical protein DA075_21620 [Methylobacterium currus]UHC17225.1 phosphatase PAP2 family protein [Methylobacterium currus]
MGASEPSINWILVTAYRSIWWQPFALLIVFIVQKRVRDYASLQIALPLSIQITWIVALFLPALGAYQFYGMTPAGHAGIAIEFTDAATAPLLWLRQPELPPVMPAFSDLRVISFPSWHAAAAVIFMLAAWPVPRVRWLALALNGLMLAATPVHGSHYASDMIVGAAIGGAAFAMGTWALSGKPLGSGEERARSNDRPRWSVAGPARE